MSLFLGFPSELVCAVLSGERSRGQHVFGFRFNWQVGKELGFVKGRLGPGLEKKRAEVALTRQPGRHKFSHGNDGTCDSGSGGVEGQGRQ